jgi:uncharacterized protein with PIN domain
MIRNPYQIVVDTSVIVAGLRSNLGAAFRLLTMLNDRRWQVNVSVALVLEYEAVLKREQLESFIMRVEVDRAGVESGVGDAGCGLDGARVFTTTIATRKLGTFSSNFR